MPEFGQPLPPAAWDYIDTLESRAVEAERAADSLERALLQERGRIAKLEAALRVAADDLIQHGYISQGRQALAAAQGEKKGKENA